MKVTLAVQQNMKCAPKLLLARDSTNEKLSLARVSLLDHYLTVASYLRYFCPQFFIKSRAKFVDFSNSYQFISYQFAEPKGKNFTCNVFTISTPFSPLEA